MNPLELEIAQFADKHLRRDLASRLKKLGEEYGELAEAIANGDRVGSRLEAADCGIVLTDIAHLLGASLQDLMAYKFQIVQERVRNGRLPKGERLAA